MTRLCDAARDGNLELIQEYLLQGDNPNQKKDNDTTPLHEVIIASGWDDVEVSVRLAIADALLTAGADINAIDNERINAFSPLHWAAESIDTDFIDFLITKGANVNQCSNSGDTPLHRVTRFAVGGCPDYASAIASLLKAGANLYAVNNIGFSSKTNIEISGNDELKEIIKPFENNAIDYKESKHEKKLKSLLFQFNDFFFKQPVLDASSSSSTYVKKIDSDDEENYSRDESLGFN